MSEAGSGKVLDIKAEDLKSSAPTFSEQSGKLREALTTLTTTLDGLGAPWGEDEQGKQFAKGYTPARKKIENATKILIGGLASIHEAMADMSDGHVDNDKLIGSMFSKKGVKDGGRQDAGKAGE
ncbi:hypothetical protein [Streptomyces cinnamoneus]|uniref:hypothetical protein n=1 Tax=Streptomyces cinnamoneus TaxID=53446 RepID=UPI001EFCDEB9|nr:hypothetical protein [Streptomyces cinnamoneus]